MPNLADIVFGDGKKCTNGIVYSPNGWRGIDIWTNPKIRMMGEKVTIAQNGDDGYECYEPESLAATEAGAIVMRLKILRDETADLYDRLQEIVK